MIKYHEEKSHLSDPQIFSTQMTKIDYSKLEPSKQKQQIMALKIAMTELRNSNQIPKEQMKKNLKSKCTVKRQIAQKYSYTVEQLQNKHDQLNDQTSQKKQKNHSAKPSDLQKDTSNQPKNKFKYYNPQKNNQDQENKIKMLMNPNMYVNQSEQLNPITSARQSERYNPLSGRLLPHGQLHYNSLQTLKIPNRTELLETQDTHSKFDYTHMTTKNKLIDNLVADLRYQIQQKNEHLHEQKTNHKNTKRSLKKTLNQNQKLAEMNNNLLSNVDLLQKQNQYLKQQIVKQTQAKYKTDSISNEVTKFCNTTIRRYCEQFQLQCLAMDAIFCDFQRMMNCKNT